MEKNFNNQFREELTDCLTNNILPYWIEKMTDPEGGYYGRRDGNDHLYADAPKGAILQARVLWSFSAAYRRTGNPEYLAAARHAFDFILKHFIDKKYGGAFWSVSRNGESVDTKKQFYAIAFIIYGLSEYYLAICDRLGRGGRVEGDEDVLNIAYDLFESIETHARDFEKGGYIEATTRDWEPIADMRLSERDANASKTMNTHLHILEGYTNLLRALKKAKDKLSDESIFNLENTEQKKNNPVDNALRINKVEEATKSLLKLFLEKIENPETHHLTLFFDGDWKKFDDAESYGHDIEASWLLLETAEVIGDKDLFEEALKHTEQIALAGLEGRQPDGSMVYERHADGRLDAERHWWVQAENVIGQLYLAKFHSADKWLAKGYESWRYIADNLIDPKGEWYWSRRADGSINREDDKAGFWKCPYHNSRMCLEALKILE